MANAICRRRRAPEMRPPPPPLIGALSTDSALRWGAGEVATKSHNRPLDSRPAAAAQSEIDWGRASESALLLRDFILNCSLFSCRRAASRGGGGRFNQTVISRKLLAVLAQPATRLAFRNILAAPNFNFLQIKAAGKPRARAPTRGLRVVVGVVVAGGARGVLGWKVEQICYTRAANALYITGVRRGAARA